MSQQQIDRERLIKYFMVIDKLDRAAAGKVVQKIRGNYRKWLLDRIDKLEWIKW